MRLGSGDFFGISKLQIDHEGVSISARHYEPLTQQPWHCHERPTLFIQLAGDQQDETAYGGWAMPNLSVTYHPRFLRHRSHLGPKGARGLNIELSDEWLAKNGVASHELGEGRTLESEASRSAVLNLFRIYSPGELDGLDLGGIVVELLETLTPPPPTSEPKWLQRVESEIESDFRSSIGLAHLAKSAGVHPVHLARVFRARHGCSVTEQIQRLRIQAATQQILEGDSIGSAALDAGFADQFHFSRTFQSHFGYCPKLVKRL